MKKFSTVVVKLKGGLGNQMFQYAFGKKLAHECNLALKLDKSLFQRGIIQRVIGTTPRKYELGEFNIQTTDTASDKDTVYTNGFWQNEDYFKDVRKIIIKDFSLRRKSNNFVKLSNQITKKNSVSIHFRRGDYVKRAVAKKFHGVLGFDYYFKSINLICRKVEKPHFFVFSDDIDWVEKNFKIDIPVTYIKKTYKLTNPEELILMSLCKHNIVANSSFSWWGAWLNRNPKKIVLAPKKWFRRVKSDSNIVPPSWTKI